MKRACGVFCYTIATVFLALGIAVWLPLRWFERLLMRFSPDGDLDYDFTFLHEAVGYYPPTYLSLVGLVIGLGFMSLSGVVGGTSRSKSATRSAPASPVHSVRRVLSGARNLDPVTVTAFLAILLAAVWMRIDLLGLSARYDEATTFMEYAQMPWMVAMTKYTAPNNHILHTLLAHASISLFGDNIIALRLPALLAGTGVVAAAYFYLRAAGGANVALVGMSLVATNQYMLQYSVDARGYSMVCLLFLGMSMCVFGVSRFSQFTARRKTGFGALTVLSLYTTPAALYGVAASYLNLAYRAITDRGGNTFRNLAVVFRIGLISSAVVAMLYGAIFLHIRFESWKEIPTIHSKISRLEWSALLEKNVLEFRRFVSVVLDVFPEPLVIPVVLFALLGLFIVLSRAGNFRQHLCSVSVAVLVLVAVQGVAPFDRVWVFLVPLLMGLIAIGIVVIVERMGNQLLTRYLVPAIAVSIVFLTMPGAKGAVEADQYLAGGGELVNVLEEEYEPGDRIVAPGFAVVPLSFYFYTRDLFDIRRHDSYSYLALLDHMQGRETHPDKGRFEEQMFRYVYWSAGHARKLNGARRIWFVHDKRRNDLEDLMSLNPPGFSEPVLVSEFAGVDLYFGSRTH